MNKEHNTSDESTVDNKPLRKQPVWQIILSTIAAAFGVQSQRNQERDFEQGSIGTYIVSGIIFTFVFILAVIWVVKTVLANSGL